MEHRLSIVIDNIFYTKTIEHDEFFNPLKIKDYFYGILKTFTDKSFKIQYAFFTDNYFGFYYDGSNKRDGFCKIDEIENPEFSRLHKLGKSNEAFDFNAKILKPKIYEHLNTDKLSSSEKLLVDTLVSWKERFYSLTDGDEKDLAKKWIEHYNKELKPIIVKFVKDSSWFTFDQDDDNELIFSSRKNTIDFETPGRKDLLEGVRLAKEIMSTFPVKTTIEPVDEWAILIVKF